LPSKKIATLKKIMQDHKMYLAHKNNKKPVINRPAHPSIAIIVASTVKRNPILA